MLSGFVVSSTDNLTYLSTLAAAPWLLAAAHAAAITGGPLALLGVAAASFLTAAGGDPMGWAVALGLALAQALLLPGAGTLLRRAGRALALLGVAALAASPAILPVLAWIPHSSRGAALAEAEYQRWNLHPFRLLELLLPHLTRGRTGALYNGVHQIYAGNEYSTIPWVLSLYAGAGVLALALLGARRDRRMLPLALGVLLFAWMAMGPHAGFGQLARRLPVLSTFRFWEKLEVWLTLLLAVLAGAGVDALLAAPRSGRGVAARSGLAGASLLGLSGLVGALEGRLALLVEVGGRRAAAAALVQNLAEGTLAAGLALVLLALVAWLIAGGRLARLAPAALLLVVALDLVAAIGRAYVLVSPALVSEPSPLAARLQAEPGLVRLLTPFDVEADRWPELTEVESAWRWAARTVAHAWNVPRRVGNLEAYTGMLPARMAAFHQRVPMSRATAPSALWGVAFVVVPAAPGEAAKAGLAPPFEAIASDPGLPAFLLQRPARPRAYLAGDLAEVDAGGALDFVASPGAGGSGRSVVEGALPPGYAPPVGQVRLAEDEGERVVLEATADRPALLVLNDAWAHGWTATVDGRPAAILPANYLVRGVWIGPGTHQVAFSYRTPWLREGLGLGLALLAGLMAWGLARRWAPRAAAAGP
jgi:hypothetical protein